MVGAQNRVEAADPAAGGAGGQGAGDDVNATRLLAKQLRDTRAELAAVQQAKQALEAREQQRAQEVAGLQAQLKEQSDKRKKGRCELKDAKARIAVLEAELEAARAGGQQGDAGQQDAHALLRAVVMAQGNAGTKAYLLQALGVFP